MSILSRVLDRVMDAALAINGRGGYPGEGDPRWAYTIAAPDGSPYLSRLLLPRVKIPWLGEWRPMLHHFHRADNDRTLHNHPWLRAFSLVLTGAYDEERLVGSPDRWRYMSPDGQCVMCGLWRGECAGHRHETDMKKVRRFNSLSGDDYHQVDKLHGDVWTLFLAGEKKPDDAWGFLDEDGAHVPHQEFLAARSEEQSRVDDHAEVSVVADSIMDILKAYGLADYEGHP